MAVLAVLLYLVGEDEAVHPGSKVKVTIPIEEGATIPKESSKSKECGMGARAKLKAYRGYSVN